MGGAGKASMVGCYARPGREEGRQAGEYSNERLANPSGAWLPRDEGKY